MPDYPAFHSGREFRAEWEWVRREQQLQRLEDPAGRPVLKAVPGSGRAPSWRRLPPQQPGKLWQPRESGVGSGPQEKKGAGRGFPEVKR
jgi:hypothetical protein